MDLDQLNKLKRHDLRAQESVYKEFAPYLFRIIYRYIGDEEKTSEVLNDTYYKAFTKVNTFDNDADKFIFWIRKIAINECLQLLRKRQKIPGIELESVQNIKHTTEIDIQIDLEHYYKLILLLPEQYRTIFNLAAIEGFTHKEISEKMNIPENTSKSLLLRARRILMEKIEQ